TVSACARMPDSALASECRIPPEFDAGCNICGSQLLEEAHIKVSSVVSDLLGISARRMLHALADGETDPTALAMLAAPRLRATPEQLRDASTRVRSCIRFTADC